MSDTPLSEGGLAYAERIDCRDTPEGVFGTLTAKVIFFGEIVQKVVKKLVIIVNNGGFVR